MSAAADDVPDLARFEIRGRLGSGGMGMVYRAYDRTRRIEVALKTMRRLDAATLYRFKNEFRSLAGIVHANLVTLYELHAFEDQWCFTMELVDGVSLLEYVRPHDRSGPPVTYPTGDPELIATRTIPGPDAFAEYVVEPHGATGRAITAGGLRVDRLRSALPQLVEGVSALHRAGKLHRDLKPSNVLVDRTGRVVVCDFGLVSEWLKDAPPDSARRLVGTPRFMSPEQITGGELGPATDWYGLGVTMYVALTGRAPFEGTVDQIIAAKQTQIPRPPGAWAPEIPDDLADLCMALVARDPAVRPTEDEIRARLVPLPFPDASGDASSYHPGALTVAVARSVDESSTPSIPPPPSPAGMAAARAQFFGRTGELAELHDAFAASRGDHSVVVSVHGPSGIGKSALLDRFLGEVAGRDAVVLRGRCYERESVPHKALDSLVDALAAYLFQLRPAQARALITPGIAALAQLFPVLCRVQVIEDKVPLLGGVRDPQQLRLEAFTALRDSLVLLAAAHPTAICIDDLQWGDTDSAAFLADLIENPQPSIGLLIYAYRSADAETSPLLRVLRATRPRAASDVRTIAIDALSLDESRALAQHVLGFDRGADVEPSDPRIAAVVAEAGGHPLFIAELARAIAGTGLGAERMLNLDDVLAARIARLPSESHALLVASSVAGRPLPVSLIGRVSEITDEAAALATLQSELLVRTRWGDAEQMIEPYHDRIRETVVARLAEREARSVHRGLARALEATHDADPIALVDLWLGAGDAARACAYAAQAAKVAEHAFAFDRAAHYYRVLLKLGELDAAQRRALTVKLGDALRTAGMLDDAAATYLAAADGAERNEALELRRRALEQLLRSGRLEEGVVLTKQVLKEIGLRFPRSQFGALVSLLWQRTRLALRGLEFRALPPDQIDAEQVRKADVCWAVSSGLTFVDPLYGTAFQTRQLIYALAAGDPRRVAIALSLEAGFRSLPGGGARAQVERLCASAIDIARESGDLAVGGLATACAGLCHILMGEFRVGHHGVVTGERAMHADASTFRWHIDVAHNYEITSLLYLGRTRELVARVRALLRDADERGDEYLLSCLRSLRSNTSWLVIDDVAEARSQLAEDVRRHPLTGRFRLMSYFRVLAQAQIDLYSGDGPGAWRLVSASWRELEGSRLTRIHTVFSEANYLRARAALAAAVATAADRDALLRDVERSARALDRQRVPWTLALATLARASAAALRGDSELAARMFQDAADRCAAADLALYAAVARFRRGQVIGGDDGAAACAEAAAWMRNESVAVPERLVAMLAPG
jgi:serine/threonine protein kinase